MNKLKAFGIGALTLGTLALAGCKTYLTEYSDIKHGKEMVTSRFHHFYEGISITRQTNGRVDLNTNRTEWWGVEFTGNAYLKTDSRKIFNKVRLGEFADVTYRERYLLTCDDTNHDGTNEVMKKEFSGYEVIDSSQSRK